MTRTDKQQLKQVTSILLFISSIILLLAIISTIEHSQNQSNTTHNCIDLTHSNCDGLCECDGLGCFEHSQK